MMFRGHNVSITPETLTIDDDNALQKNHGAFRDKRSYHVEFLAKDRDICGYEKRGLDDNNLSFHRTGIR